MVLFILQSRAVRKLLETVSSLLNKNGNLDSLTLCHKTKLNEISAIYFYPCNSVLPQNTGSVLLRRIFYPILRHVWWHLVIWHRKKKETLLLNAGPRKKRLASPLCFILIFCCHVRQACTISFDSRCWPLGSFIGFKITRGYSIVSGLESCTSSQLHGYWGRIK